MNRINEKIIIKNQTKEVILKRKISEKENNICKGTTKNNKELLNNLILNKKLNNDSSSFDDDSSNNSPKTLKIDSEPNNEDKYELLM